MGPHREPEGVEPQLVDAQLPDVPAKKAEPSAQKTDTDGKLGDQDRVLETVESSSDKVPLQCFITCDIPFNWLLRPEMLFGPVVFIMGTAACGLFEGICYADPAEPEPMKSVANGSLYVGVVVFGKVGMIGLILNSPRWVAFAMASLDLFFSCVSLWALDTSVLGAPVSIVSQALCAIVASCLGKLGRQHCKYFLVSSLWLLLTQMSPIMVFRFDLMRLFPGFLEAMALPIVSCFYSAVAVQSLRWMNRSMIRPGMPIRGLSGIMYPVLGIAQCLLMCGFIPRRHEFGDSSLLLRRYGGAVISTVGSVLLSRFFVFQRLKHAMETVMGLKPPPLMIEPEMDSYMRTCFALDHITVVWSILLLLLCMPARAYWSLEPLVWLGILVRWLCALLCDLIVVLAHRRLHHIPNESLYQTTLRLQKCFQHWPQLQSDGGRNFQAAEAAAASGESSISPELQLSPEAARLVEVQWSAHSYFTDARAIAFMTAWCPIMLLMTGFRVVYGDCGVSWNLDMELCQVCGDLDGPAFRKCIMAFAP